MAVVGGRTSSTGAAVRVWNTASVPTPCQGAEALPHNLLQDSLQHHIAGQDCRHRGPDPAGLPSNWAIMTLPAKMDRSFSWYNDQADEQTVSRRASA